MYTSVWPFNDTNCHFLVLYIDQPKTVTFSTVNATAVSITWSGSTHLSTSLKYTSYSGRGILMTQYIIVLPPSVISTEVTLNDNFAGYEHVFMLQYISTEESPITTATFSFGEYKIFSMMHASIGFVSMYIQIKSTFRFNLAQLTTVYNGV